MALLFPSRTKYRKRQRKRRKGVIAENRVVFGEYGLIALEPAWITNRQIEAGRTTITRAMSKKGRLWIRVFPDMPYTKKPLETRMGKGKGDVDGWVAVVRRGAVLFEIAGVNRERAEEIFRLVSSKLPIKTKVIERDYFD